MAKKDKKPSKQTEKAVEEVKEIEVTEVPEVAETPEVTEVTDETAVELVEDTEAAEVAEESEEAAEVAEESEEAAEVAEESEEAAEVAEESEEAAEVAEESEEVAEDAEESEETAEVAEESEEAAEVAEESEETAEVAEESEETAEVAEESEETAEDEEDEFDFVDDDTPIDEIHFENEEDSEDVVDLFEEAAAAEADTDDEEDEVEEGSEIETVDPDDYLDYDEDEDKVKPKRPKKIVSGKTAVVTMLFTFLAMIGITTGIFAFLTYYQKPMELSLVSYTDRFNECDTNSFAYGSLLGLGNVSYSDAEMTFSKADINALKKGETVTKFDGLANITADVSFGKIVSLDFTFSEDLNNAGQYMMIAGNVMSGLTDGVISSDYGFMFAYSVISYAIAVDGQENMYCYQLDDMKIYVDYTDVATQEDFSKIKIHVESADPHYIDWSGVDLSWLPWNKKDVSDSDVSGTDA